MPVEAGTGFYTLDHLPLAGVERLAKAVGGTVVEGATRARPSYFSGDSSAVMSIRLSQEGERFLGFDFEAFQNEPVGFRDTQLGTFLNLRDSVHFLKKSIEGVLFVTAALSQDERSFRYSSLSINALSPQTYEIQSGKVINFGDNPLSPKMEAVSLAARLRRLSGPDREAFTRTHS